ncbi:MAG: hypothetical protein ABSC54_07100 [Smithellaceae bacterium]|jgi:type II secretory pathway component PulJ
MKKNGWTILELIIYMGISMIIMAAVYAAVVMAQRTSSAVGKKTLTQQDARFVLDMMAMDIRNASYNSLRTRLIWQGVAVDANGNASLIGVVNNNFYGIQLASTNQILVEMDLNNNGIIDGTNEAVFYGYNGVNTITRANTFPGGNQVLLGGVGSGTLVHNAQANVPLFQYFDGRGNLLNPVVIPSIRRITITIVADTEANDLNTGAPKRMIYSTDVLVKNHAVASYTK